MAIVRYLVELHGGTVRVHSEGEGQGATFTIELPTHLELTGDQDEDTGRRMEDTGTPMIEAADEACPRTSTASASWWWMTIRIRAAS